MEKFLDYSKKGFKLTLTVICFIVIFFGTLLIKGSILFAASNIRANLTLLCQTYNMTFTQRLTHKCVHVPAWWDLSDPTPPPLELTTLSSVVSPTESSTADNNVFYVNYEDLDGRVFSHLEDPPSCIDDTLPNRPQFDVPFVTSTCDALAVRWVWCIVFIMITVQIFIFLRCFWYICFKSKMSPTKGLLIFVSTWWWREGSDSVSCNYLPLTESNIVW